MKGDKDLRDRTKKFALQIVRLVSALPSNRVADVMGRQLLKAATSIGANCREAMRARSKAEFISKIGIVEQESDETLYWLELIEESGLSKGESIRDLVAEANALTAIFTAVGRKAKI